MSDSLFDTGIRPKIDEYLLEKAKEERDYGDYWSASSAGYCMRRQMFSRLKVPEVKDDARKERVFEVGHIFHEYVQRITRNAGISIAQEVRLQDKSLMVRGHFDDLVIVNSNLMLVDYKSVNSRSFSWAKKTGDKLSYYHRLQVGTYMYMLRRWPDLAELGHLWPINVPEDIVEMIGNLSEARILKISKDDLRMGEQQLMWSLELESDVAKYWGVLNGLWKSKTLPPCTCADREGGFLAREAYNPYFFNDEPCSVAWAESKVDLSEWKV